MSREFWAEFLGTGLLVAVGLGAAQMGATMSPGNDGVSLLAASLATGGALAVLITLLAPVSGAHLNPAVTLVFRLRGEMTTPRALSYLGAQILGGFLGAVVVHAMFDLPLLAAGTTARSGTGVWLGEVVATFGLLFTILGALAVRSAHLPALVGTYVMAGYWFTASTGFANPAVTLARSLSLTPPGLRPVDAPGFILAELVGAVLALVAARALFGNRRAA